MRLFKKLFIHSYKHYIIATASFLGIVMIYMWFEKFKPNHFPAAFIFGGMLLMFVGALLMLSYLGAFDTLGYAFTTFKRRDRRPYKDLVEYTEVKQRARKAQDYFFTPYMAVGLIFCTLGFANSLVQKLNEKPTLEGPKNFEVVEYKDNVLTVAWTQDHTIVTKYDIEVVEYCNHEYENGTCKHCLRTEQDGDKKIYENTKDVVEDKVTEKIEGIQEGKTYIIRIWLSGSDEYYPALKFEYTYPE